LRYILSQFYSSKRVLVTGGAGFVGSNLIERLLDLGAVVTATLYKKPVVIQDKRIAYLKCDLRNPEDCRLAVKDIDYVFMCAANTSGAKVMATTPLVHLTPNILMNVNMLEASYEARVEKFLFMSSNTVYPLNDYAVKEDDVTNEFYKSYYIVAWMKRFTEIVCDMYSTKIQKPMKTVVVRPGNLYGPRDKFDWEKSKVIPALIRRAVERQSPFVVWGDGMDLKDFLYIDDYIDGMLSAMEKLEEFQPVNIASGKPVRIREVLSTILQASNYEDAIVEYDTTKPTMIPKRLIDISLAKDKLGWEPKISLRDGIKRTVNYYKETFKNKFPEEMI
jgi:GDP-L-fucose synthase